SHSPFFDIRNMESSSSDIPNSSSGSEHVVIKIISSDPPPVRMNFSTFEYDSVLETEISFPEKTQASLKSVDSVARQESVSSLTTTQLIIRSIFSVTVACILIGVVIASYALRWHLVTSTYIGLGVYGVLITAYYVLQTAFAITHRIQLNKSRNAAGNTWTQPSVNLLIVGYREKAELFESCLRHAKDISYGGLRRTIVVIDGNSDHAADLEMRQVFTKVFPSALVVFANSFREVPADAMVSNVICIVQKHAGKRATMYLGFKLDQAVDAWMVTDSDTELHRLSMGELAYILASDTLVGAVTGDVGIFNQETAVSFLSSLRYWWAFNIERAAQSYFGTVMCVSGPLGVYRTAVLNQIVDEWADQKFFGRPCSFGDDRHLTNLVLKAGWTVKYTHLATCATETPTGFFRWVTQQTRWSKSFYRECLISLRFAHRHSAWMLFELCFQTLYPFLLLFNIISIFVSADLWRFVLWIDIFIFVGLVRAIVPLIITRRPDFLLFFGYTFMYMAGLLMAKMQALVLVWHTTWGTSPRAEKALTRLTDHALIILWLAAIAGSFAYSVVHFVRSGLSFGTAYIIGTVFAGVMVGAWIIAYLIIKYRPRR
ncbi:Hyaluronan synthase 3, partial [Gonapodya sp. JEL0774]